VRVWLASGVTDMRRGMNGLALQVQQALRCDPHGNVIFALPTAPSVTYEATRERRSVASRRGRF
jgi:transposase